MTRHASAQIALLRLEAIEDDLCRFTGGQLRAVLDVGTVNLALEGEVDQEATIASFAAFLNGLTFPIQILVRAMPVDVAGYVAGIERRALQLPESLAALARDHASYVRRLARARTLLERRFYVVVPSEVTVSRRGWWPFARPGVARENLAAARKQLTFRCEEAARQLGRCGLATQRLGSAELAELLYTCWCPELARVQRLRHDLADYTPLVVRADRPVPAAARRA